MAYLQLKEFRRRVLGAVNNASEMAKGDSIKSRIVRSTGWMSIGYGADLILRFISTVILTRILDPSAYGLITTVMVFLTVATMISDIGIRPIFLTSPRSDDREFVGVLWTIQVLRGFFIAALVTVGALVWFYAQSRQWIDPSSSYANPLLPQLTLLISLSLIVNGFNSLNELRAVRDLEQGLVSKIDMVARLASTVTTIVLVLIFRSVWAMAAAIVLMAVIRVSLLYRFLPGPRMHFSFDWADMRGILSMSRWVAFNSMLVVLTSQVDKILFGYSFGLDALGVFAISLTLYTSATAVVNQLNTSMGIPVLRALADKPQAEQEKAYYRFRLPIDLYCIAGGVGMALLGPLFFQIVYDPRYAAGGHYLALLGIKVVLTPLLLYGNFLMAQMRYKMTSFISLFRTIVYVAGMAAAVWLQSIELMVLVIALERLPEILLYIFVKRAGVPFHKGRDGLLLAIAALIGIYTTLIV